MPITVKLNRIDYSGVYALPEGITGDQVSTVILDGYPVNSEDFEIVSDGTAIDVVESSIDSVVEVILK